MAKGKYAKWLEEDNLILLQGWARDGLTDEQIAHNMGINVTTLYRWKSQYCDICNALKKTKEVADREVENALFKSALGYEVNEETWERRFNKKTGDYEMALIKKTVRHIAPSNAAQIFWLKNRRPHEWREKQEIEVNEAMLGKAAEILGGIKDVID